MTTVKATFGGRVPLVNLDEGPSIPSCFILQLPEELTPSHIGDGFGEAVVLDHVLDGKTLDAYDLVLTYDLSRELVLIVTASIGNTSVYSGNLLACFVTVLGTFAFLCQAALCPCQLLLVLGEKLGVAVSMTVRSDDHRFQAQVQPDHFRGNGQGLDLFLNQDGDEVATCTVLQDSHGRGLASIGQGTRPHDVQGRIHLGKREEGSIPLEGSTYVGCRLRTLFLFERGITGTPLKEIDERFIQVAQGLLQGNTSDFTEPYRVLLLLQVSQGRGQMSVVKTFTLLVVGIGFLAERPIIHITHTTKRASQHLLLLVSGITPILVCAFLFHVLHCSIYGVERQGKERRGGAFTPSHEWRRVLPRRFNRDNLRSYLVQRIDNRSFVASICVRISNESIQLIGKLLFVSE